MTVMEIMERAGSRKTGQSFMFIKEALNEIATITPTHTKTLRIDIVSGKRFYEIPKSVLNLLDIRCLDHYNDTNTYKSIPRVVYEPGIEDTDGV